MTTDDHIKPTPSLEQVLRAKGIKGAYVDSIAGVVIHTGRKRANAAQKPVTSPVRKTA